MRLVDAAGVAADDAVDEARRARRGPSARGSRSGCCQTASRASAPTACGQPLPQRRGLAQLAGPQLQADQRREGLLGGAAGGAAAAQRLAQRRRAGDPVAERVGDDGLHPALDEGEQRLEPFQRRGLLGRGLRLEDALVEQLLHLPTDRSSDAGLKPCGEFLDAAHVDLHALGEGLDGVEQLARQPRHVAEQAVVGGLARGEERHDLAARLLEALGERLDGLGHQRGHALGAQRQADVGGGQHFLATACRAPGRAASRTPCRPSASSSPAAGRPWPWPPRAAPTPTPSRSARPPGRTAASRCPGCCRSSRSASTPPTWWCPRAGRSRRRARSRPAARRRRSPRWSVSGTGVTNPIELDASWRARS